MLALFALQAIVPFGYMPVALKSGALLQLCPQGISAELMAVLHGAGHVAHNTTAMADHHHDAHADRRASNVTDANAQDLLSTGGSANANEHQGPWQNDCPYGSAGPTSYLLHCAGTTPDVVNSISADFDLTAITIFVKPQYRPNRSRAPPDQPA